MYLFWKTKVNRTYTAMKLVMQIYEENLDNKLGKLLRVHCQNLLLGR